MVIKHALVPRRKQIELIDFIIGSVFWVPAWNQHVLSRCFYVWFGGSKTSPLKGATDLEPAAPIRGMRGCA
jgi:hypothetical protein